MSRAAADAAETSEVLFEMSNLLNTGLDKPTLNILIELCENGVNPEALAHVVRELRRESAALKEAEREAQSVSSMGLKL
ncbi:hypothetical protein GUITHDRAFT_152235 [Guillardia theta CCMP2712]|uniref:Mitotic-spindle organizing protein 1 n=1 Tax=Guillardia theta (strain CCMP2712) TaxID=905079 RepID=L1JFK5_GUITC|nr:hypothetical protein GUITHDRAFT_152235 [Guillardia theta CCMP2712]EKX46880.1 hypothetical protein GUITHDRAFT_152235 [Guillardia theta CCMP2712]|eukprot:XP_005833860.1 hypothetical protein GUITHDRAFT_152235 [Guillardia theta CCMP2712]